MEVRPLFDTTPNTSVNNITIHSAAAAQLSNNIDVATISLWADKIQNTSVFDSSIEPTTGKQKRKKNKRSRRGRRENNDGQAINTSSNSAGGGEMDDGTVGRTLRSIEASVDQLEEKKQQMTKLVSAVSNAAQSEKIQDFRAKINIDLSSSQGSVSGGTGANEDEDKLVPPPAYETNYSCLLYTSPSPRDRQKSRMPSSA